MRNTKSKVLVLMFVIPTVCISICCSTKSGKGNAENDQFVEIYYLKSGLRFPMQLNCTALHGTLMKDKVNYKKVDDPDFINKFSEEFRLLKDSKNLRDIDSRIQAIYHHDKETDTICMGEHFDIQVNGVNKTDSKSLLKLITDKIY